MNKKIFLLIVLIINVMICGSISAEDFGSHGTGQVNKFESCGKYNGCISNIGFKLTIYKNYVNENSLTLNNKIGKSYDIVNSSSYPYTYDYDSLEKEIKKGKNLFNEIIRETGVSKNDFFTNNYVLLVEPYFELYYWNNYKNEYLTSSSDVNTYIGNARQSAIKILELYNSDNGNGYSFYGGFRSVTQLIPCTTYMPDLGIGWFCDASYKKKFKYIYIFRIG